jgi:hypothetical protein
MNNMFYFISLISIRIFLKNIIMVSKIIQLKIFLKSFLWYFNNSNYNSEQYIRIIIISMQNLCGFLYCYIIPFSCLSDRSKLSHLLSLFNFLHRLWIYPTHWLINQFALLYFSIIWFVLLNHPIDHPSFHHFYAIFTSLTVRLKLDHWYFSFYF